MRRHVRCMRRLISILFFAFSFVLFLSLNVETQTICGPNGANDLIMRISGTSNAMGENATMNNYPVEVCYSSIFSTVYSGSNLPGLRVCTATNKVVRLSGSTNAHAETPDNPNPNSNYNNNVVCYGDLQCVSVTGSNGCPPGKFAVVSLSDATNAHLGNPVAYPPASGSNDRRICCSATPPTLSALKWSYYDGTQIPVNDLICPNSYVIMNVTTGGIASGNLVDFELWDDKTPDFKILPTGTGNYRILQGMVSNNQANVTLNLSDPELFNILESARSSSGGELELYFKAEYPNANDVESYEIGYDGGSSCIYPRPTASVRAPIHKGVYFKDTTLNFESGCTSRIGPLEYEWIITQEGQTTSYTSNERKFDLIFGGTGTGHFGDSGQANVKLKCTDMRGQSADAESQILIVASDKKNTLAYIEKPAFESFWTNTPPTSGPYFAERVNFSAADSFAVDVVPATTSGSCPTVSCLGGSCPLTTQNKPVCIGGSGNTITITNPGAVSYSNLFFNWTFWDDNWNEPWASYDNFDVENGAVNYDDISNSINDKHMSVLVNYTLNDPDVSASASFQRDFTLGRCLDNGNKYYESSSEGKSTTEENNACKGGDGNAGTGDDCCPVGYRCMNEGSSLYSCKIPPGPIITECRDFTTRSACNSNNDTRIPLASNGGTPSSCTLLQCYWITSGVNAGTCGLRATRYQNSQNGCGGGNNGCVLRDCAWTTTQTECTNGWKTITYNSASPSDPPLPLCLNSESCVREPVDVPCGSLNFELSFFGKAQFIISIISIALLYFAFNFYRGRKNERKK